MNSAIVASVVFLKIQDFSRRPASEQARMRAQLEAVVAVVTAELPPRDRIVVEASDGAAIVVLGDPLAALRLAERALTAAAAGLPLSAGLNHGTLQFSGAKGGEGIRGDGIAVAAHVAEFAPASRLLASRAFRDAVADSAPGREAALIAAGTFSDPSLRSHEVFSFQEKALARRRRRYAAATVAMIVALLGAGFGWRITVEGGGKPFADTVMTDYPYVRALVRRVSY
jgi:class 3 adenylate cyclase